MTPGTETPAETSSPSVVLSQLRAEYLVGMGLLTEALGRMKKEESPTTYQTYRWFCGAFLECAEKILALAKAAGITIAETIECPAMITLQIPLVLADAEKRVIDALKPMKLDDLPPGNPKEPEFERLLKIKIATNRVYSECLRHLGTVANALNSDTYKIGLPEEQRDAAWRKGRRVKLEQILADTQKQIKEAEEYLTATHKIEADVVAKLKDNDQLNFFSEIDPDKQPDLGEVNPET